MKTLMTNKHAQMGLMFACIISMPVASFTKSRRQQEECFDYVVVGSGPGGATCANRLAADGCSKVLVLEAGPNWDDREVVRQGDLQAMTGNERNEVEWDLWTKQIAAIANRQLNTLWGRVSGGCSSHNGKTWALPDGGYFDRWQAVTGGPWSAQDIENQIDSIVTIKDPNNVVLRGHGPLIITQSTNSSDFTDASGSAFEAIYGIAPTTYPRVNDFETFTNTPLFQGTANPGETFINPAFPDLPLGIRTFSSEAFLYSLDNLTFRTEAPALRVVFNGKKAVGVEYFYKGECRIVKAKKGVVLAAGFQNTPKLLNVSGIGSEETLNSLGIKPVSTVPAGEHYLMQVLLRVQYIVNPEIATNAFLNGANIFVPAQGTIGHIPDTTRPADQDKRGFQFQFPVLGFLPNGFAVALIDNYFVLPLSEGTAGAVLNDPTWNSVYNPNPLAVEADLVSLAEAGLNMRKFKDQMDIDLPGFFLATSDQLFASDEFLTDVEVRNEWVRTILDSAIHDSGTCRMGPNDGNNVVDCRGAVYGTKHLYVADTSISPFCPPCGTVSMGYIIGNQIGKILAGDIKECKKARKL